jgi:hypothetical protein
MKTKTKTGRSEVEVACRRRHTRRWLVASTDSQSAFSHVVGRQVLSAELTAHSSALRGVAALCAGRRVGGPVLRVTAAARSAFESTPVRPPVSA